MNNLYDLKKFNDDSHFLLYSIQYYIYMDIPEIWEYILLKTLKSSYSKYIIKAQEIGFEKIINDYQNFIKNKEREIYNHDYPLLRFKVSISYDKVFSVLSKYNKNQKEIYKLWYINWVQDFINDQINTKYRKVYQIPKIICKITNIKSDHKFFYINLVTDDPYDINIPMTIWLYQNENNIIDISISKIIKYFMYFHVEEVKIFCKNSNIYQDNLFDYLFENIKKKLTE